MLSFSPHPGQLAPTQERPPDWWSCHVLATDIDEAAVEGADGVQEPRATSLDCSDPQQVPSQLAPLALPGGPRDATLRTSLSAPRAIWGHGGPCSPPPSPAGPRPEVGLLIRALGLASGTRGMDGDLQSFAHPFSSGKDKGPYLGSPSWSGAVLGSGVPASPRFSDPWALEVSQPEKGAGPTGCRHGAGGALAPTPSLAGSSRPWGWGWGLAVPSHLGFELTLGCLLCAPHPGRGCVPTDSGTAGWPHGVWP